MQAIRIEKQDAPWTYTEVDIPKVGANQVLIKIKASGICGSDVLMNKAEISFGPFPISPGHEGTFRNSTLWFTD